MFGPTVANAGCVRLAWLVILMAGCGIGDLLTGGSDTSCSQTFETDFDVTPSTPQLQLKIEQCRLDVDACPGLCTDEMQAQELAASFQSCTVTFDGATAKLAITYQVKNEGNGCAIPELNPSIGI